MMRLSFLLLALVACAAAVPQLSSKAGNVDALKKQRDVLILLRNVFGEIPDEEFRKTCKEYDLKTHIDNFRDKGVVKFLIRSLELRHIQRKGVPFTTSITKLRREVTVLTRVFLGAKDYNTFIKTAAWVRCRFNEAIFVKAFVAAVLQRHDTQNMVVLPALYEVFPYYYFDNRVIRKAKDIFSLIGDKTESKKDFDIKVHYSGWLPKGEDKLAYWTQDVQLNSYYAMFSMVGWMLPYIGKTSDEPITKNVECERCEIGRGAMFYYMHQQLLARYGLERLSNNLPPVKDLDITTHVQTPFKPHLSFPNGLEFPGRGFDIDLIPEKDNLFKNLRLMERRILDAIDSGFTISTQGSLLALYDNKGLNILGNIIEGTGRSINPRFYGAYQGAFRQLLGGGMKTQYPWEPVPSALELSDTAVRDPIFHKLNKRITEMMKRFQESLPLYTNDDLMMKGVKIENVKFDKLVTYCDKLKVDLDAVTMKTTKTDKEYPRINAVVDTLNHKPYKFEVIVNSEKAVKGAIVRVYMGPKYDYDGNYVNIEENRLRFVELDQFIFNLKEGKNTIVRRSDQAPMRSMNHYTFRDIFRKVEGGLNAHEPYYPTSIPEMYGFPERLALPKGKRNGLPLQIVVIISPPKMTPVTYGPVLSEKYQTYHYFDFDKLVGDYTEQTSHKHHQDSRESSEDFFHSGERYGRREETRTTKHRSKRSDERFDSGSNEDTNVSSERKDTYLTEYYKDKNIWEMVGGYLSLDGRPLGYPFDRPLSMECLWIPNIKVIDVNVFYEGIKDCMV